MARDITLRVKSEGDTKALDDASGKLDKLRGSLRNMAVPAAAAGAALTAGAAYVKGYASEAQQAIGSVETVFGDYANEVKSAAAGADQALGLSEAAYNSLAANVGGALKAAGVSSDELGGKTDDLMTRAADLASVFGGETTEATAAMGAALRGEFDSLERFGVFLNAAAVEAELARTGQDDLAGSALDAAKKQATYNLMMQQAADYAGNFAREADTAAGAEQRATAARENAAAAIGSALLPAWTSLNNAMATAATWVANHSTLVLTLAGVLGVVSGAILALNAAMMIAKATQTAWAVATRVAAAAQVAWNFALSANPLGLIVLAIAAVVAAVVIMYNRFGWFRDFVHAVGAGISSAWSAVSSAVSSAWSAAMSGVQSALSAVGSFVSGALSAIGSAWRTVSTTARTIWSSAMTAAKSAADRLGSGVRSVLSRIGSGIRTAVSIVRTIGSAFRSAGSTATGAIQGIINRVSSLISWVSSAIDRVRSLTNIGGGIRSLFGSSGWVRAASAVPVDGAPFYMTAAAGPSLLPAAPLTDPSPRRGATRSVRVNIYGAIDPNRTARHVRRVLDVDLARDRGGDTLWT